jgi:gentisate 1,2-dioxygenase
MLSALLPKADIDRHDWHVRFVPGADLMPVEYRPQRRASPLLVYPYDRTREALDRVARNEPLHPAHGAKMRYANPNDGGYVYPTLAVFIQWMPKQSCLAKIGTEGSSRDIAHAVIDHRVLGQSNCGSCQRIVQQDDRARAVI